MNKGIKGVLIFTLAICAVGGGMIYNFNIKNDIKYNNADKLIDEGRYREAADIFAELGDYRDCRYRLSRFNYVVSEISSDDFSVSCSYTFNRNGLETGRYTKSNDGREGRIIREYNRDRQLTYLENQNLYETGRTDNTTYEYDNSGRMKRSIYKSLINTEKEYTHTTIKTDYEYNSDNQVKHAKSAIRKNNVYTGGDEIFCYYDGDQCISKVSYTIDDQGENSEAQNIVYKYDGYGRLKMKDAVINAGGNKVRETTEYRYNGKNKLQSVITETYNNADGKTGKIVFLYQYQSDELVSITASSENLKETYTYTYDKYRNIASYTYKPNRGLAQTQTLKYEVAGYDMPEDVIDSPLPEPESGLGIVEIPAL